MRTNTFMYTHRNTHVHIHNYAHAEDSSELDLKHKHHHVNTYKHHNCSSKLDSWVTLHVQVFGLSSCLILKETSPLSTLDWFPDRTESVQSWQETPAKRSEQWGDFSKWPNSPTCSQSFTNFRTENHIHLCASWRTQEVKPTFINIWWQEQSHLVYVSWLCSSFFSLIWKREQMLLQHPVSDALNPALYV